MEPHRWKFRPEGSNWGDFGADDQLGRLNLITPQVVLAGVAEVREGRSFCLSLPLDLPGGNRLNPRRHAPRFKATQADGRDWYNLRIAHLMPGHTDIVSDDAVLLHTQYSTQWDSFAHMGQAFDADGDGTAESVYYNGFRAGQHILPPLDDGSPGRGAQRLGIETMAVKAIQGRGVLLNLLAHCGAGRTCVGYDTLLAAMEAQQVQVAPGDMLCLYTGFADAILRMAGDPDVEQLGHTGAVLDGRDERLQRWIADSGIAALVADNYAVEGLPSRAGALPCAAAPLHELCLFKLGIPLGELWHLGELAQWLAAHGRTRFLLTAPPLRLPGAVGSPVTPVATV